MIPVRVGHSLELRGYLFVGRAFGYRVVYGAHLDEREF